MRTMQRLAGVGTLAVAAALTLVGCSNGQVPGNSNVTSTGHAFAPVGSAGASSSPAPSSAAPSATQGAGAENGSAPFGKSCSRMPQQNTAQLPAGKAIAANPMLHSFARALERTGFSTRLDRSGAHYTVFAPADSALDGQQLSAAQLQRYVVDQDLGANQLSGGKQLRTLAGGTTLRVSGSGENLSVAGPDGSKANVLCGNIKAANATIYIVDHRL